MFFENSLANKVNSVLMKVVAAVVICAAASASLNAGQVKPLWSVSTAPQAFREVSQAAKQEALDSRVIGVVSNQKTVEQTTQNSVSNSGSGSVFQVLGNASERRTMKWIADIEPQSGDEVNYYMFRYKAKGIFRDYSKYGVVCISGKDASGVNVSEKLIDCSQIINDDRWHTVIGKKKIGFTAASLDIEINTDDSVSELAIESLEFYNQIPDAAIFSTQDAPQAIGQLAVINLDGLYNDSCKNAAERSLNKHSLITDYYGIEGIADFGIKGLSFNVKAGAGGNIITSPEDNSVNQEMVDFLGSDVPRKYFFPITRDDSFAVNIDKKASEVFLILVSEFPASSGRYGVPAAPVYFDDVEMFSIELVYDDGQSDLAFPYSISDEGYVVRRAVGEYAVVADENRTLKSMVFHNRFFGATVGVAAVTVNTSANRIYAHLAQEPQINRVPAPQMPPFRYAGIERSGDVVRFANSYLDVVINCSRGFAIEKFVNLWSAATNQSIGADSGLRIDIDRITLTGLDFSVEDITIRDLKAVFNLKSKIESVPLELTVAIGIDNTSSLTADISVKNNSDVALKPEIAFPYIKDIQIGDLDDVWMYFPTYRNVFTNEEGFHLAGNDHTFPMQFYDVYNPAVGIGLAFITHNLTYNPIDYSLSKDSGGVCAFIRYPAEFYTIEAGQSIALPQMSIVSHSGDWRAAAAAYKQWLKTWYKPNLSPQREWFNKISLVKDYFLHETVSLRDLKVPSMFSSKTGEFRVDEYLEKDKEYWGGLSPDMIHFFHWSHLDPDEQGDRHYGNYGYDYYGGLDNFKSALNKIQTKYNTPVSLYMVPDRCSTGTETGKRLGKKAVKLRADGSMLANDTTWYVCPQQEDWLNDFVENAKKIQKETNSNVMYFDVVGFWRTNTCYSKEHGHPIPSWYNQATYDLMTRLRAALPEHVAIWTEYPLTDVNTQYTDGNIAYYYLSLYELWAKPYNMLERPSMSTHPSMSLYRFIFPHIKQVDLPIGNESAANGLKRLKFTFFNGDAIYDNGWLSMQERTRKHLMIKAMAIKQKFSDCFYSADITPLVDTERGDVYANKFDGTDKTLYTIFNGRYTSVGGAVLALEHKEGDTYYDAWNEMEIVPQIVDGRAILEQKLAPQALGCIVQYHKAK